MKPQYPQLTQAMTVALAALLASPAEASVNSYRFLHVTIDTPWHIFLFLMMGIFAPFILMVVLMWRNSSRKRDLARDPASAKSRGPATPPSSPQPPQA
jgi:hypothetical protein